MSPSPADDSPARGIMAVAEELRKDCQRFQLSLVLLEREVDSGDDDECLRHLEKAGRLRQRISQRAQALQQRQADARRLSAAVKEALRRQVTQSQRLLVDSSETCAKLAERVSELHADLGEKLHAMRKGSKMLGSYKTHACIAGGTYSSGA